MNYSIKYKLLHPQLWNFVHSIKIFPKSFYHVTVTNVRNNKILVSDEYTNDLSKLEDNTNYDGSYRHFLMVKDKKTNVPEQITVLLDREHNLRTMLFYYYEPSESFTNEHDSHAWSREVSKFTGYQIKFTAENKDSLKELRTWGSPSEPYPFVDEYKIDIE